MDAATRAANNGQVEVIKVLVELGADKDAKTAGGGTPLHHAAGMGYVEAVKVLAQLGADIAAQTAHGEKALQVSIRCGQHEVAQVLRELESTARAQQAATREQAARSGHRGEERGGGPRGGRDPCG